MGEFIVDRWLVKIVRDICAERGIEFHDYSEGWLLELRKGGQVRRILGYRFALNDSVAAGIAQDKVATHEVLKLAGLPSVPHTLLRTKVSPVHREVLTAWDKVVVKPLSGTSGHGVRLFDNADTAIDWIESTTINAWAASPFVAIEREIRVIMLDQKPLIVYEKLPVVVHNLPMFNLGQGATPRDMTPDEELLQLAARAQETLGLRLSTVDIVETVSGERQVLEINDGVMMENYARFSSENKQRTIQTYGAIIDAMMQ